MLARCVWVTFWVVLFGLGSLLLAQEGVTSQRVHELKTTIEDTKNSGKETIWVNGNLPVNSKMEGEWFWDTAPMENGTRSHSHSSTKGLASHGFTADPVSLSNNGMIIQQVWLDPKDPPRGIMLKFKRTNGEEVGVYWEGEEEVFNFAENREAWYYGSLPKLGKWTPLEIQTENLGLEVGEKVVGLRFATFDGRALWGKTVFTETSLAEKRNSPFQIPTKPAKAPKKPAPQ